MRILLINTNAEKTPQVVLPMGACRVATAAAAAGHDVQLLDLAFTRDPVRQVAKHLAAWPPEAIGLSIRNLDNCDALAPRSYLPGLRAIADACRPAGVPLLLGGAAVGLLPDALRAELGATAAVAGAGEQVFPALLDALARGEDPTCLPGVTTAAGTTPPAHDCAMPALPAEPARWLPLARYQAYATAYPLLTKRGCPGACCYCTYPLLEGTAWQLHAPDALAEEVHAASMKGFRHVEIVDSIFGLPADHTLACCATLARRHSLPMSTMDLNPAACTVELAEAMNAAGFAAVGISADSASDTMLATLQKGFDTKQLHRAVHAVRRLRAQRLWLFLLGGPGETEHTVNETVRFIEGLPATDLVYVTLGVRLLPGTLLHQRLRDEGHALDAEALLAPTFYHSPHIGPARILEKLETCTFPSRNIVSLHDSTHRLVPLLQRACALVDGAAPYWRHLAAFTPWKRIVR
jgi:radical SAM superfamily enzyme YgiQ (UPF0313 family)